MTQSFASGIILYLAKKLTPGGTVTLTEDPGVDQGRLFFNNNFQVEWLEFTSVTPSGGFYVLGGVTRDIDQYAIPATSNSTGKTWLATQSCVLVQMHDQMLDITIPTQILQEAKTYATEAARDTALGGNGVATVAYTDVYVVSTGLFYNYNLSSNQWEAVDTGTVTPNASETVAGKVEIATPAQSKAGDDTGETGATLSVKPSDIAKNTQSSTFVYGESSTGNDTYTVGLIPALTAYTTGMRVRVKFATSNTGACSLNIDSLGAKNIKLIDGTDPLDGDIVAGRFYDFIYDGTNLVLQQVPERSTDAEALAGNETKKYITPKQAKDNYAFFKSTSSNNQKILSASQAQLGYNATYVNSGKEIIFKGVGTIKVGFEMALNSSGLGSADGQLYKNGVAVGTNRSTGSTTFQLYEETISVKPGDIISIYGRYSTTSDTRFALYRNLAFSYDKSLFDGDGFING